MTRKRIGYFEGTDAPLLTALMCDGYDTIPVSNGRDHHGSHARLINDKNRVDLLIAYVHKIVAPDREARDQSDLTFQDLFHICRTYDIPLIVETPTDLQQQAFEMLDQPPDIVRLVDPGEALQAARAILTRE